MCEIRSNQNERERETHATLLLECGKGAKKNITVIAMFFWGLSPFKRISETAVPDYRRRVAESYSHKDYEKFDPRRMNPVPSGTRSIQGVPEQRVFDILYIFVFYLQFTRARLTRFVAAVL